MSGPNSLLEIDGSYLEGGGQILRNALSFSCILRRPIRISKIRANRPNPGLSNQHLFGLNLLMEITNAQVKGNFLKSTEVEFWPGPIQSGSYKVNTQTAASISLVLQAALPVLLFGSRESQLELIGGTNVGMAPQVDFMTEVFRPNLELMGASFDFDLIRRGYYPRGGGCCKVFVPPIKQLKPLNLIEFGKVQHIEGWCYVAGRLPMKIAQDMQQAAESKLKPLNTSLQLESYKEAATMASDNGSGLIIKASTSTGCVLGSSALGEKQVNGQQLGGKAAEQLESYLRQQLCVDEHVQDQLILFMALAQGISQFKTCALTNHTRTAMHVAEQMLQVKFNVKQTGQNVIICCEGMGYQNTQL